MKCDHVFSCAHARVRIFSHVFSVGLSFGLLVIWLFFGALFFVFVSLHTLIVALFFVFVFVFVSLHTLNGGSKHVFRNRGDALHGE